MIMVRTSSCAILLALALLFSLSACEDDGSGDSCKAFASDLRACGLLTAGEYNCGGWSWNDCEHKCLAGLDCSDLSHVMCGFGTNSGAYTLCTYDCSVFDCGDGQTTKDAFVCDGDPDCANGADEIGCPSFGDDPQGTTSPILCDGFVPAGDGGVASGSTCGALKEKLENCSLFAAGGSVSGCTPPDTLRETCQFRCALETGCEDLKSLVCSDGQVSGTYWGCMELCEPLDDSDPNEFQCASGEYVLPKSAVCDGYGDCYDGSDEIGCATLVCL
jgi:hypothetical protein